LVKWSVVEVVVLVVDYQCASFQLKRWRGRVRVEAD